MNIRHDLILISISKENDDGSLCFIEKEIVFKEDSDNVGEVESFLDFLDNNKGEFGLTISHYKRKK